MNQDMGDKNNSEICVLMGGKMHTTKTIKQVSVLCLVSLFFFMPRAYSVQEDVQKMARFEGAVLNIDNEPIPNAKIQLKHADSDQVYRSESNETGNFSIPLLPPGNYHVAVEKEGFKSFATELKLQPGVIQPGFSCKIEKL